MPDWTAVRGFTTGLVLLVAVALVVLTLRPGGLRHALANAARRLRLALLLVGLYLAAGVAVALVRPDTAWTDAGMGMLAAALGVVFLVAGRDRPPPPPVGGPR